MALGPTLQAQEPVAAAPASKAVLGKAEAAYYNLAARGFKEYRFQAQPDWASLLGDLATTNPEGFASSMKLFSKVRFDVVVDRAGGAKITHNNIDTPNDKTKSGMDQVYGGMDQMLTGFFQTWNPFMITTPFSRVGTDLRVEAMGATYRFRWVEGGDTKVDILTDGAFAVTEMKVSTPVFDSVIRPVFDRGTTGLVLASYEANYQEKPPAPPIRVSVLIRNKPIQGLLVPAGLELTAWVGDNKTHILMTFADGLIEKIVPGNDGRKVKSKKS